MKKRAIKNQSELRGPAPCSAAVAAQLAAFKARGCFRCDGTKRICNICGESAAACRCGDENFDECLDCKTRDENEILPQWHLRSIK